MVKKSSYVEGGDPKNREDGEVRKLKNDPHNPKNLLRRKKSIKSLLLGLMQKLKLSKNP